MRPWAQLDRLLRHLPRHSLYKAALDNDEEFAAIAAEMVQEEETAPSVPLAGYDEVVVRLDNLFDAMNAINETLVAVNSSKRSAMHRPNRAPRPQTAYQRIEERKKTERLDAIVQRMTGGR